MRLILSVQYLAFKPLPCRIHIDGRLGLVAVTPLRLNQQAVGFAALIIAIDDVQYLLFGICLRIVEHFKESGDVIFLYVHSHIGLDFTCLADALDGLTEIFVAGVGIHVHPAGDISDGQVFVETETEDGAIRLIQDVGT